MFLSNGFTLQTRVRAEEFPTLWAKLKWFVLKRIYRGLMTLARFTAPCSSCSCEVETWEWSDIVHVPLTTKHKPLISVDSAQSVSAVTRHRNSLSIRWPTMWIESLLLQRKRILKSNPQNKTLKERKHILLPIVAMFSARWAKVLENASSFEHHSNTYFSV